jgi:HD-GYP domain-containing protein (c-di-GMP phosphodiesterase class II)
MESSDMKGPEPEEMYIGLKVKNHIVNSNGLLLVPAGTVLDRMAIDLVRQHRIPLEEVKVSSGHVPGKAPESAELIAKATDHIKDLFDRITIQKKVPYLEIKHELLPIVNRVAGQSKLFELVEAVKAKDEYTHQHNIGVGVLSALLGNWLNLSPNEVSVLTLAATLHDLGKLRISQEILQKPDKLTPVEYEEIKRHTVHGYQMLKDTVGAHARVALVALQHHERADGTGYPLKLTYTQVDPYSRIVAVADVFHAMSSNRPYHKAMPFFEVVRRMREDCYGSLDPEYVSVFLKNMMLNLIGQKVVLTDGRLGEVVSLNPHEDTTPLVRIQETFLDLSKERHIQIDKVIA